MKEDMPNNETEELFSEYLSGKLDEQSRKNFEKNLSSDENLNRRYEDYKEAVIVAESLGIRNLMAEVIQENELPGNRASVKTRRLFWPLAAAVAAALLAGIFLFKPQSSTTDQLFQKHFEPFPDLYSNRDNSQSSGLNEAIQAYQEGNFIKAIDGLNRLSVSNDTIRLYLGTAYIGVGNLTKANEQLRSIDNALLSEAKNWYLGLSFLKAQQMDSSTHYFRRLDPGGDYGKRLQELLNKE